MQPDEDTHASNWNELLRELPQAHIMQTSVWGQAKRQNGWEPNYMRWNAKNGKVEGAAMVLERNLSLPFGLKVTVLYCPKGPTLDWNDTQLRDTVLKRLEVYAKKRHAVFIKIDPDVVLGWGASDSESASEAPLGYAVQACLVERGWQFSSDQIQFRNTVLIDLNRSEEEILAGMKQKTRYNIRLAARKGVSVRQGDLSDIPMLYQMYAITAVRDNFVIRHEAYYASLWKDFFEAGMADFLIAEYDNQPIAAIVLFHFAGISRYMFGMSLEAQRDLMPNYLLQWEAIRLSKSQGCQTYDLWGAPDVFDESDSLWGVYRFKEGFNGTTTRHIGAWDYAPRPFLYTLYTKTLPKILDLMRSRGKAENRKQSLS
ncbi:MAG: peptidoglycan bridge formation glycyltransferase FemA/FemB family protein [Anaerolineaceae bacterium]